MKNRRENISLNESGFTIIEVLISAIITAILITATMTFYVRLHNQSENQYEISEAQNLARSSLYDINKNLRMAGYKVPTGHDPYTISGDSLYVYYKGTNPVDTILYFLEEFTNSEYAAVPDIAENQKLYKLMKQENSGTPNIYADFLTNLQYTQVSASSVIISLEVQTEIPDHSKHYVNEQGEESGFSTGFTTVTLSERVKIRNVAS